MCERGSRNTPVVIFGSCTAFFLSSASSCRVVGPLCHHKSKPRHITVLYIQDTPQHGPWRWRRFVKLLVAFGLARQLLVNVTCSHANPQSRGEGGIMQQDSHLEDIRRRLLTPINWTTSVAFTRTTNNRGNSFPFLSRSDC